MNPTPDATTAGNFDPRQAAALLDQTTQQTRRRTEAHPPWFLAIRAFAALGVLGTVWLSVRGQHPYDHPTAAVVPVCIAFGLLNVIATIAVAKRATAGVSRRVPLRPAEIAALTVIWIGVFVVMGVLASAGVSHGIVYGVYPVTVPLIVAGLTWAGIMAARSNWPSFGTSAAVAVVGAVGLFAGPVGAWAVAAVGLCLVLLTKAAITAWQQRRSVIQP
ncbi:MAG TPA: hypothetical protein VGH27_06900 [Streptosporangiaceae bacterium]|jgi:hypothetical protein